MSSTDTGSKILVPDFYDYPWDPIVSLDQSENFLHFMGSFLDYNSHWDAAASDYYKVNMKGKILKRYEFSTNPIACGILYRRKNNFGCK